MRLNKYIAHAGSFTRREAERLVRKGEVKVNGKVMENPAYTVLDEDEVKVRGKLMVIPHKYTYLLLNKPKNTTTIASEYGEYKPVDRIIEGKTKVSLSPLSMYGPQMLGLMVYTDDVSLQEKSTTPVFRLDRIYDVFSQAPITESQRRGLKQEQIAVLPSPSVDVIRVRGNVGVMELSVLLDKMDMTFEKIDCIQIGKMTKKDLPRGWSRYLTREEVILLKHFSQ